MEPRPKQSPPQGKGLPTAIGSWISIERITVPAAAYIGDTVKVEIDIKNIANYGFYASLTGIFDSAEFYILPAYTGIAPGATQRFSGSFIMPNKNVNGRIYAFYWTGSEWYLDDQKAFAVLLGVVGPAFSNLSVIYKKL